jgi:hypothetical protein
MEQDNHSQYYKEWMTNLGNPPCPYQSVQDKFWEENSHLLTRENYPDHWVDSEGLPLFPVEARIPLEDGQHLIDYQWPCWVVDERLRKPTDDLPPAP